MKIIILFFTTFMSILLSSHSHAQEDKVEKSIDILDEIKSPYEEDNIRLEKTIRIYREIKKELSLLGDLKVEITSLAQALEHMNEDFAVGEASEEEINKAKQKIQEVALKVFNKRQKLFELYQNYLTRCKFLKKTQHETIRSVAELLIQDAQTKLESFSDKEEEKEDNKVNKES